MKTIKKTTEVRCYSEEEAKNFIENFRQHADEEGYTVGANGYTYKTKKSKGEIVSEGWLCKCIAIYNEFWEEGE